jgi:ATP-dependent Clp protease ATP-binding subunit ClpC
MSVNDLVGLNNFNLTPRAKKAFKDAQTLAKSKEDKVVNNLHILHGCIQNLTPNVKDFLFKQGIDFSSINIDGLLSLARESHPDKFFLSSNSDPWHKELLEAIQEANIISADLDQYYIGIEHVLMGLMLVSDYIKDYLKVLKIDSEELCVLLHDFINSDEDTSQARKQNDFSEEQFEDIEESLKTISKFGVNLNQMAINGEISEIYGREKEIDTLIEVLSKKNKRNAVLIGEAGVGKTAIVEGLALKIVEADVPPVMLPLEIYSIDLASMIAGARYRGDFEEKFKNLLNIAKKYPHIILFFDEIHNIFGAGNTEGTVDAANMLKPYLARGEIKCIGATTTQEYQKIFEKDAAMKRRFEPVDVEEPSRELTLLMINESLKSYEEFHNVQFAPKVIDYILDCCEKFLPHRRFPDKAFDIIDQIGSRVKIDNSSAPSELLEKHSEIVNYVAKNDCDHEEAEKMLSEYFSAVEAYREEMKKNPSKVQKKDVEVVMARQAKIGVEEVRNGFSNFDKFYENLSKDIIGQSKNLEKINDLLSYAKMGFSSSERPLANLLFVGPTSVGKTYTAKKIAKYFFGNEKAFIQINMSELQDETAIGKLIGANAGYVGYNNGGLLTNFVRNNPNSVVLFDEIEKSNPKILNILLHLMDEGYLMDNLNRRVDFSKTIVVLTSNIGHQETQVKTMGFVSNPDPQSEIYLSSIKKQIRPEIIARINEIVVFDQLTTADIKIIIQKEIDSFKHKLLERKIKLNVCANFIDDLMKKNREEGIHARSIKEVIKRELVIPMAKFILSNPKIREINAKMVDKAVNFSDTKYQAETSTIK